MGKHHASQTNTNIHRTKPQGEWPTQVVWQRAYLQDMSMASPTHAAHGPSAARHAHAVPHQHAVWGFITDPQEHCDAASRSGYACPCRATADSANGGCPMHLGRTRWAERHSGHGSRMQRAADEEYRTQRHATYRSLGCSVRTPAGIKGGEASCKPTSTNIHRTKPQGE